MTACRAELTLRPDEFQSTRLPQKADQARCPRWVLVVACGVS